MLWGQFIQDTYYENLGDVAEAILELLAVPETPKVSTEVFTLPEGWEKTAPLLHPVSVNVPCKSDEAVSETLRAFFAPLAHMEEVGIGGSKLMIAMNEDLLDRESVLTGNGLITVYTPACFDFQLATGEDSLITQVIQGSVSIEDVVIGCDSSYIEKHQ